MRALISRSVATLLVAGAFSGCSAPADRAPSVAGDTAFRTLAAEIIEDLYRRSPSFATYQGVHRFDTQLETFSPAAVAASVARARTMRQRLDAVAPESLSETARLDREFLQHELDATIMDLDVVRAWATNADLYSSTATDAVFSLMKRRFAPAPDRLKLVIARERLIPGLLAEARVNLKNPPRIFTQMAIDQNDGIQNFFRTDLPLAFADVQDAALLAAFRASNDAVLRALADYKRWLQTDLLPRSTGSFALGAAAYSALLAASDMIDTPLDELLRVAEADRVLNERAFVAAADAIDPRKSTDDVLRSVTANHPTRDALLSTTQGVIDSLRTFITDKGLATIPPSAPAEVRETPPFMRATSSASMDTPGPWETTGNEAFFYVTLPDPRWSAAEQEDYMRNWYHALIVNVAVHEVYPGHFLQFVNTRAYPTDVRRVFSANSNSEGWAHYVEQMMLEEGFHADDPAFRLAQLQDALLRDVRLIVGIKMHTQGMTVEEATQLFMRQAHQPATVARAEATRGAGDPLYGYYTLGKLAILKLRRDYRALKGPAFTLRDFHDTFIRLGPLPLPLVRQAMLGERGQLF